MLREGLLRCTLFCEEGDDRRCSVENTKKGMYTLTSELARVGAARLPGWIPPGYPE